MKQTDFEGTSCKKVCSNQQQCRPLRERGAVVVSAGANRMGQIEAAVVELLPFQQQPAPTPDNTSTHGYNCQTQTAPHTTCAAGPAEWSVLPCDSWPAPHLIRVPYLPHVHAHTTDASAEHVGMTSSKMHT